MVFYLRARRVRGIWMKNKPIYVEAIPIGIRPIREEERE